MDNTYPLWLVLLIGLSGPWLACQSPPPSPAQYPSPMMDQIRPHERMPIEDRELQGVSLRFSDEQQGQWYASEAAQQADSVRLLIHFHGEGRIPQAAVAQQAQPWVLVSCHWGGGSSSYQRPIQAIGAKVFLDSVLSFAQEQVASKELTGIYVSGFSAGYGAIRAMLQEQAVADQLSGILLLDGLHTSYVPERQVLSAGGSLDSAQMRPFVQWAERATQGKASLLITHSSIFPGTYSSTTETADYLLNWLQLSRNPMLAIGPGGMQQTSVATRNRCQVRSYAGNTAPDHIDHLHGMGEFLRLMKKLEQ